MSFLLTEERGQVENLPEGCVQEKHMSVDNKGIFLRKVKSQDDLVKNIRRKLEETPDLLSLESDY
jgi:hypothetical protein